VKVDGRPVGQDGLEHPAADLDGQILQMGKRRFVRVEIA
jgi:hypothetical protein